MKNIKLLFLMLLLSTSCKKEPIDRYIIKGVVLDEITQQPIANLKVDFDAVGGKGIFGGRRKPAGSATSDSNGKFECKLKVFEDASFVEPSANTLNNDHYEVFHTLPDIPINDLKKYRKSPVEIFLLPTTTLLINFKNVNPFSDSDSFSIGWVDALNSDFSPQGSLIKNCGAAQVSNNGHFSNEFIGENVCGTYKYKTAVNDSTNVKWYVKKNNITITESATIYCQQGKVTEFTINY